MTAPAPLTAVETRSLRKQERIIEHGMASFVEVGEALLAIRDARLYRATHATFEDYCRERWELSRAYAYRQIEAAEVAKVVSPNGDNGDVPVPNEAVARELAPLKAKPQRVRQAYTEAVETARQERGNGATPTAREVKAVTQAILAPEKPTAPGKSKGRLTLDRAWGQVSRIEEQLNGLLRLDEVTVKREMTARSRRIMRDELLKLADALKTYAEGLQ